MLPLDCGHLSANARKWLLTPIRQRRSVCVLIEEETPMPQYVTLVRYTQQGMSTIKESPARLYAAKKSAEAVGGKVLAWYLTMGQYDAVLISEFPTDETCATFTLSAGQLGNISTETMKAFPEPEYRKIIEAIS